MFIVRKARKLKLVEQNLCEYQSMNQRAEYTVRGLNKKLSDDLVEMLVQQLMGFHEYMQEEIADDLELFVKKKVVKTTGCPSVDCVLDVCYMWIAAELGELKKV